MVESSGGVLELQSTLGGGTTSTLSFPECPHDADADTDADTDADADADAETDTGGPAPAGADALTVLVVDDRPELSELVERALRRAGVVVHVSSDPVAALHAVRSGDVEVDVVVTDIVMPSMSGIDLAHGVRAVRPGSGVVFMSGYSGLADQVASVSGARFLAKPFAVSDLVDAVRTAHVSPLG